MSRTAGGEHLLGDTEKEALLRLMWRMARFSGLEIHTYAVMKNHFHIDLNPLRAGMVKDPKDYRWSGYGEAMGGGTAARSGLCRVVGHADRGAKAWNTPPTPKG